MIDSHIQMPRFMLKRFENENHRFFYYDVKKSIVGSNGRAGSINTEQGYYSETAETHLNAAIETPFSKFLRIVDQLDINNPDFSMTQDRRDLIVKFMLSLMCRNPNLIDAVNKRTAFFQLLSNQAQHDYVAVEGLEIIKDFPLLKRFFPTFTVSTACIPFVLPTCGVFSYTVAGIQLLSLPISPRKAVTLFDLNCLDQMVSEGFVNMFRVDDDSAVQRINGFAFRAQLGMGNGYVVTADKEELIRLTKAKQICYIFENAIIE